MCICSNLGARKICSSAYWGTRGTTHGATIGRRTISVIHRLDQMVLYIFVNAYGVATISRLLEIIGLFCRISSLL